METLRLSPKAPTLCYNIFQSLGDKRNLIWYIYAAMERDPQVQISRNVVKPIPRASKASTDSLGSELITSLVTVFLNISNIVGSSGRLKHGTLSQPAGKGPSRGSSAIVFPVHVLRYRYNGLPRESPRMIARHAPGKGPRSAVESSRPWTYASPTTRYLPDSSGRRMIGA